MLLSYEWLTKYLQIDLTPTELGEKIERTSVEVDSVTQRQAGLKKLVVGEIESVVKHPDAGHLNICQVAVGAGIVQQIVCGAPNVTVGKKVIVALPGARVAGNQKIKKAKMRGVKSDGMLCALDEIGFDEEIVPDEWKDGIYFLPDDAQLGDEIYHYLGMDESLLDLDVTPNRGDMLSLRGVVYDLAAILNQPVIFDETPAPALGQQSSATDISAAAPMELATQYQLQVVKNVTVASSPLWLQIKLWNAGIKPINNVVDVTNYVMLKLGQPLHAYDLEKITGKNLQVRRAQSTEQLVTLDGTQRDLDDNDVVIADQAGPVALAGLMGGEATKVTAKTQQIVLEAAAFSSVATRKMAQKEGLHTDASQRFERGIDQGNVTKALNYAAGLLQQIAAGTASQGTVVGQQTPVSETKITVTPLKINQVLGTSLQPVEIEQLFKRLGFEVTPTATQLVVTVPTRCWDLKLPADLYEEIARIYGYDHIPTTLPVTNTTQGRLTEKQRLLRQTRRTMEGLGFSHAISYSLTTAAKATMFNWEPSVETSMKWPMSSDHAVLRQNLIAGLLDDISYNQARGVQNVSLYEQGRVFFRTQAQVRPIEKEHLAGAVSGSLASANWATSAEPVDFFQLKGLVEQYLASLNLAGTIQYKPTSTVKQLHPNQTAEVWLADQLVGLIGQVHPLIAQSFHIKPTYVFELDLEKLALAPKQVQHYQPISAYPSIKRDIAMLVGEQVSNAAIEAVITDKAGAYLQSLTLFDVYAGNRIPKDQRSLAYSLTFSNPQATLQDEIINQKIEKITTALKTEFQATIR
ncbi:phenylalanine--tRNA ligase subunit beta [Fructilactobacillus florum]|uniref:Phenylalanine--tRNA ligase beta subunit n=1 Tax=Fructilactobacillus florum DSM 22689 = JCM 16035 TaxID=1423745 RepID=A0A0R2CJM6_9LACO|nr:phenylalanine--tRNA ligase subunit beta [Fructilactobacillus florum]KRM91816.1 phenylalanyl-tRNA synthetase subunit beta [Fructilactobacillus florum DSM 22689 = JCM 16035]